MDHGNAIEPSEAPHASAPDLPKVRDEAPDSPWWLPVAGLGVLLALGAMVGVHVWRARAAREDAARAAAAAAPAEPAEGSAPNNAAPNNAAPGNNPPVVNVQAPPGAPAAP